MAAAVWSAVANGGLKPICVTGNKLYGTWGDPKPVQDELVEWLRSFHRHLPEYQNILDHRVVRVCRWTNPPLPPLSPFGQAPVSGHTPNARWIRSKAIAYGLLPPLVTRALQRTRARLR